MTSSASITTHFKKGQKTVNNYFRYLLFFIKCKRFQLRKLTIYF
jgi:hypothetical protein